VPVVSGVTNEEPQTVIAAVAREHGCRLLQLNRDFHFEYLRDVEKKGGDNVSPLINFHSTISGQEIDLKNLQLAMRGPHQAANAAVALATVAELRHQGWCISTDAMRTGLVQASLPGRVEILSGNPAVVLDTAHNPASAQALVETLAEMPSTVRRSLIVSISHDKDVPAVVRELVPHFQRIIVTQYQENPRAVPVETLTEIVRTELSGGGTELVACRTPEEAWELAVKSAVPGELFCITGSFFLAAEMRPLVLKTHAAETLIPVIRL
jgi:dihydrofolate synthase / folylpolyglutamate synthase